MYIYIFPSTSKDVTIVQYLKKIILELFCKTKICNFTVQNKIQFLIYPQSLSVFKFFTSAGRIKPDVELSQQEPLTLCVLVKYFLKISASTKKLKKITSVFQHRLAKKKPQKPKNKLLAIDIVPSIFLIYDYNIILSV